MKKKKNLEEPYSDDCKRQLTWVSKRIIDLSAGTVLLGITAVPMGFIALLVKVKLGSPVIFRQERPGRFGLPFTMYKFRTMTDAIDTQGNPLPDHERLTPFGRWLRSTSLDELPELYNVLRGDMSLVGPRPLLLRYTKYFTTWEKQRLQVRPGITGLAQVSGRNTASWEKRLAADVKYVQELSLFLDFRIIFTTVINVISKKGFQDDPQSFMKDLDEERKGLLNEYKD